VTGEAARATLRAALREPQQERSRATRQRLLGAAVECLCELGWLRTSVSVVAERAGVSRGAAQHYFPTREDLFTTAIEYMAQVRMAEVRRSSAGLPDGAGRTEAVVSLLMTYYTGPLFRAALQVWVAASADESLRAQVLPLERKVALAAHREAVELLGADERAPGVRELVQATLDLARGLALADFLSDDTRRREGIIRQWAATLDTALKRPPGT
jgi:AcrR family transcriptional regulator